MVSHKKTGGSKSPNNQIFHHKNDARVGFDGSNRVAESTQFDVLQDEIFGQQLMDNAVGVTSRQGASKDTQGKCMHCHKYFSRYDDMQGTNYFGSFYTIFD